VEDNRAAPGFFYRRLPLDLAWGAGADGRTYATTKNVPWSIATVLQAKLCSKTDLNTTLGVNDLYDLVEIANVHAYNQWVASRPAPK
jgi:hypothetical protein